MIGTHYDYHPKLLQEAEDLAFMCLLKDETQARLAYVTKCILMNIEQVRMVHGAHLFEFVWMIAYCGVNDGIEIHKNHMEKYKELTTYKTEFTDKKVLQQPRFCSPVDTYEPTSIPNNNITKLLKIPKGFIRKNTKTQGFSIIANRLTRLNCGKTTPFKVAPTAKEETAATEIN
ncbi:hypothetical protein LXL04_026323 [Taraxacum kok-saghyz]